MPTTEIQLTGQASGWEELGGAAPAFINVVQAQPGGVRARPGIMAWADFPATAASTAAVVAMTVWQDMIIYVTEDRQVWAWRAGNVIALSLDADGLVDGDLRPTMAASRDNVIIAGGGVPQRVNRALQCTSLGGSPPAAGDVSVLAQRFVIAPPDTSGLMYWSGVGDTNVEAWDTTLEFREAESRPDKLVALADSSRELWAFGSETTQLFSPDETETFTPGPTLEYGCVARCSPVRHETRMMWLNDRREIVISDGRQVVTPSDKGMAATLKALTTVSDAWTARVPIGGSDFLFTQFPTEGRCFAFDMATESWSDWRTWSNGRWVGWTPTSYVFWADRNLHLVGLPNGQIAQLSFDAGTDFGPAVKCMVRTGFISRTSDDSDKGHVTELRARLRRTTAAVNDSGLSVRWRDDLGAFKAPLRKSIGVPTDTDPLVRLSPVGVPHQQRQYELGWLATDAVYLANVTETWEPTEI